jgi:hypothetical protein
MENIKNVSSEEELLQLRNEGKISEAEYNDLLGAMRKPPESTAYAPEPQSNKAASKRRLGKTAFYLMLAGIVLPIVSFFVCFAISGGGEGDAIFSGCLFLCVLLEVPAFVFGVISWPDPFGKASVITSSFILIGILFFIGFIGFTVPRVIPVSNGTTRLSRSMTIEAVELKKFPIDKMDGIITQSGVQIDRQISSDGNGSLRIEATQPTTVRLFEAGDIDVENARLIYQARLRTENVEGQVYLEMWCHFPGKGEFFSRGLETPLTGTTEWTTEETPFFLKAGENPDNVKLNLVIDGKGTVWIDDIRLLKGTLK